MSASDARTSIDRAEATGADLDEVIQRVLTQASTIAVVGMKDDLAEDACRIPAYMAEHGYVIVPVNPKLEQALGQTAYADLGSVSDAGITVDLVNVFRASENVAGHVDQILEMKPLPRTVWLQLGIHHGPSAQRLREAGVEVVQDRCIMVDHRRLSAAATADEAGDETDAADATADA